MSFSDFTIRVPVLTLPLLYAELILAQQKTSQHCFEQPNGAKEAIHRLPESAFYWLAEDAMYIIPSEERCVFLHLNSDKDRERFIEQFG